VSEPLLDVERVTVEFVTGGGVLRAADDVSLRIAPGETLALVGESGSGKSTVARAIVGLVTPRSGRVSFRGAPLGPLGSAARRPYLQKIQLVFQDPDASLDPRFTVGSAIGEPLLIAGGSASMERDERVALLMKDVGLDPVLRRRYPHELSGGQRQRVCIARALAVRPELIVCDEAVSALDVSVQAQIVNLLMDLRERFGLSYLFITHDLRVVRQIANRVAVMYLGQVVEQAETEALFEKPEHPYTRALLASVPGMRRVSHASVRRLSGDLPSALNPPSGCRFHTRCGEVFSRCPREAPSLYPAKNGGISRCFLSDGASAIEAKERQEPSPNGA
jgi:oligopeptide/dipeptide ABC transporter ATP-binding protein